MLLVLKKKKIEREDTIAKTVRYSAAHYFIHFECQREREREGWGRGEGGGGHCPLDSEMLC